MRPNKCALSGLWGLLLGLGSVSLALAQSLAQLEMKPYGGIPYVSGGIGLDEREALRQIRKEYNLQLIFATKDGHYLSDVEILIADHRGNKVFEAISSDPWLFIRLPAGHYRIQATTLGHSVQREVRTAPSGQTQLYFYW